MSLELLPRRQKTSLRLNLHLLKVVDVNVGPTPNPQSPDFITCECHGSLHLCVKGKPASRYDGALFLAVLLGENHANLLVQKYTGKLQPKPRLKHVGNRAVFLS